MTFPLEVMLTNGAIRNGYIKIDKSDSFFPVKYKVEESPTEAQKFQLILPDGTVRTSCIILKFNRIQARFGSLFAAIKLKAGDKAVIEEVEEGKYRLSFDTTISHENTVNQNNPGSKQKPTEGKSLQPLNQIFYGPPGTGKTYYTIDASVKAAEPNFKYQTRTELKAKYDELVKQGRIRFVTFHQNYGYEEFIEGLRASADSETGSVSYSVEDGVFKQICQQAKQGIELDSDPIEKAIDDFKVNLEIDEKIELASATGKKFSVRYHGNTTFRVFPNESSVVDLVKGYNVSIERIKRVYHGADVKKVYNSSYVKAILKHLLTEFNVPKFEDVKPSERKNFVLVIDEINRGNISKIFGELITLIETSKRSGEDQPEALEVILPNSSESFSVPSNLYLIGTMNTADRSLALMDTALRRRFDFVEMMPAPDVFGDLTVKGIEVKQLLLKMNQRIETLYDREHTLGHAFFISVLEVFNSEGEDAAFVELKSSFVNKVVPLLEEYFFDDWNKIGLILGDNQKSESLKFVRQQTVSYQALFGHNHGLDTYEEARQTYSLAPLTGDDSVWDNAEAYIAIYTSTNQ